MRRSGSQRRSSEGWFADAEYEAADLCEFVGGVAEDTAGKVWISYNSAEYLKQRHGVPEELMKNLAVIEGLASAAAA